MGNRARAAIVSLALAAAAAAPASAGASVTWVVNGGGFGHGVGLSAYGAYGYGLHGYGYKQILHHYFRQIQITTLKRAPMVRVLLTISPGDVGFSHATRRLRPARSTRERSYRAHRHGSSVRLLSSSGKLLARCGASPARRQPRQAADRRRRRLPRRPRGGARPNRRRGR